MSDREDITDVLVRYATGIDSRDWDLLRSCFSDDSTFDYGDVGSWNTPEAITEFMRNAHSGPSMHRLSNFAIEVEKNKAIARTYVDARVHGKEGRGGVQSVGYYDDELVRTAEGWKIKKRAYTSVSMEFIGVLNFIPGGLVKKIAMLGSSRMGKSSKE